MLEDLSGRSALVTGASSGIGAATARRLAAEGADVALLARREARLESLAADVEAEHGVETAVVPADVRDEDAVAAAVERTLDSFGRVDVAVVNAGVARGSDVASMSTNDYRTMTDTNVDGSFFLARAVLPHLVETEGTLVFVGSFAGQYPRPFNPVYAATKWWVRGFAHSVAAQVGDDGVAVSVVNPTEVRSEFAVEGETFEERFDPGEVTEPEEVADAIAFAAMQDNSAVQELDLYRRDKFGGW
jgi:hypothetical protein